VVMTKPSVNSVNITRITDNQPEQTLDLLAVEEPMEIRLGFGPMDARQQKSVSVTMRTPGNDFELALGFLFTEGIIQYPTDVYKIQYCTELNTQENIENIVRVELNPNLDINLSKLQRNFYTTSSCGICGKESIEAIKTNCLVQQLDLTLQIPPHTITQLPDKLRAQQRVFEHTGGIHACALFDAAGILLLLREDVGRHNALDKLIGAAMHASTIKLNETILLLSGRASFELLQKAAMASIPVVCAVGAPSSLAVQTAVSFNITLIGFLRNQRFNIYACPERITH
jgi:FdhD protein